MMTAHQHVPVKEVGRLHVILLSVLMGWYANMLSVEKVGSTVLRRMMATLYLSLYLEYSECPPSSVQIKVGKQYWGTKKMINFFKMAHAVTK